MIRRRSGPPCLSYRGLFLLDYGNISYLPSAVQYTSVRPARPGRFARVVFLDAGSAVGGSSRSSASFFWISLFHDICLSRKFSSLLGRHISVCHAEQATSWMRRRRTDGSCTYDNKKTGWGLLTEASALSWDQTCRPAQPRHGLCRHMVGGDLTYSHIAGRLRSSHFLWASVEGLDAS
jgi:hypothetical protein